MAHDNDGNLLTAFGLPPYTQITKEGKMWSVQTATAFAGIVGVPTTLANLEVVNNGQRYMVVDDIWAFQVTATAVVWALVPWAQVGTAVYSANTALVVGGGDGQSYSSSTASEARTAITQTVVANGWRVFPNNGNWSLAAATPGPATVGRVEGKLVVPPGKALHIAVSASVNTASAVQAGGSWMWADA